MERKQRFAGYGRWVLLAAAATLMLLAALAFASTAFEVYPDKDSYYPNQDVYLVVSGPVDSGFVVQVLNPAGGVVSEKSGRTTSSGNSYLSYEGFSSEGAYDVRLIVDGNVVAVSSFIVAKPGSVITTTLQQAIATTTATTGSVTTFTVTTSSISPTTPTTTVVTTGEGRGSSASSTTLPSDIVPYYSTSTTLVRKSAMDGIPSDVFASGNVRWIKRRPLGDRSPVSASSSDAKVEYDAPLGMLTGADFGSPVTETAVGENFVLSAYDTAFELVSHDVSPVSQKITYRLFNSRDKFHSYVAVATSGELKSFKAWHIVNRTERVYRENVTYYLGDETGRFYGAPILEFIPPKTYENDSGITYGNYTLVGYPYYETVTYESQEFDEPTLLFTADDFIEGWNSGRFSYITDRLIEAGVRTDLENILDSSVLPEPDQLVYVYKVPHSPSTWEYFEYETDNRPSKFLAFDPAGGAWWNDTWDYRRTINITNNNASSILEAGYSIKLTLNHTALVTAGKSMASGNDVRITWWNGSKEFELNRVNETAWNTGSTDVWFRLQKNVSAGGSDNNYYLYYSNPSAGSPPANKSKVYAFWDDFSGSSIAASKWTVVQGTWSINTTTSVLRQTASASGNRDRIRMSYQRNNNWQATFKIRYWGDREQVAGLIFKGTLNGNDVAAQYHAARPDARAAQDQAQKVIADAVTADNAWNFPGVNVWINAMVRCSNNRVSLWLDGAEYATALYDYSAYTTNNYFFFKNSDLAASGKGVEFDDIKIRLYIGSEPSATLWSAEEYAGVINVTIGLPGQDSQKKRFQAFSMNGSVNCSRGDCGNVSGRAQYFATATPTYTWQETSSSDFGSYSASVNVTITDGSLTLETTNSPKWWDQSWLYRKRINVTNRNATRVLERDYSLNYSFNHTSLVSGGKSLANGNDVRIVYWNGSSNIELNRVNETAWNTASTKVWFRLQKNVSASGSDSNYYLYYGKPSAGSPPANKSKVYAFWDDFTGASSTPDSRKWYITQGSWQVNTTAGILRNDGPSGAPYRDRIRFVGINRNDNWLAEFDMRYTGSQDVVSGLIFKGTLNGDDDAAQYHAARLDLRDDTEQLVRANAATSAAYAGATTNIWYRNRVFCSSGLIQHYINSSLLQSLSYSTYTTYGYFHLKTSLVSGSGTTDFDNVKIRYYLRPEPALSGGTEEGLNIKPAGYYVSNSLNTTSPDTQYQTIYWFSRTNANTTVAVYTRTSQNNVSWGGWFTQTNNSDVYALDYQYIQYKVELSTSNNKQTPYFDENDIQYKISTPGWANMSLFSALAAANPYACGILNQSQKTCKPVWSVTPKQVGKYAVRIYAGSPTHGVSKERNITVMADTHVIDFAANQSSVAKTLNVSLAAELLDDIYQPMGGHTLKFYDLTYNSSTRYSYSSYPASPISGQSAYSSRDAGSIPPSIGPQVRNESAFNNTAYGAINKSDNIYATTTSVYNKTHRFVLSVPQDAAFVKSVYLSWEGQRSSVGQVYLMAWNWSGSKWKTLTNRSLAAGTDAVLNNTLSSRLSDFLNGSALEVLVEARSSGVSDSLRTDYVYVNVSGKYLIGSGVTNSSGQATIRYTIPANAALGNHSLMAYFSGNKDEYLLSSNGTTTIKIASITLIKNLTALPGTVGYGFNVTIKANVTDEVGVDTVLLNITNPAGSSILAEMTPVGGGIYRYNYSGTWVWGNYIYYIRANNSAGGVKTSSSLLFYVRANASIGVQTLNDSYGPNQDVNLVPSSLFSPVWWNSSWGYRKFLNITNVGASALTNYPAYVNVSFATGMQSDYRDLRFFINSTELKYEIENYTSTNAHVWIRVPTLAVGKTKIYMYYGNPSASAGQNRTAVWDSNFKGVWHLAQGGTNPRIDSTSKYNNLTPNNGVAKITGKVDGADDFDGTNDYSESVNNIGITGNTARTISFWLRIDNTARCGIVGWGQDGASQHFEVAVRNNHWFLWGWGGGNDWDTTVHPVTGVWVYHVIVFDGTTVRWYVNGTQLGAGFAHVYNTANTHMYMAIEDDIGVLTYMNGALDEVQISNVSRSTGWVNQTRQLVEKQKTLVSFSASEKYKIESKATNRGKTNISGYLEMRVQRYSAGSWVSFEAPFISDRTPPQTLRRINVSKTLALDSIWNPAGWNTSLNPGGLYRAYVRLTDSSGSTLVSDDGSIIAGWYNFTIVSSYMQLTRIEHENNITANLNEYETADNIAWINITAINRNTSAVNASITLNVLNSAKAKITWGPLTETKYCGNLAVNASCEKKFDNSTAGYPIPLNAIAGGYRFYWNVTLASKSGASRNNNSLYFRLHNVPDNTSSTLAPTKIFQNKSAIYNFTLTNPWSKNLTAIRVKINCPTVAGLTCRCLGTALNYCNISSLAAGAKRTFRFNISTSSTPVGDYTINATLNYTNPGLEKHSWPQLRSKILMIRIPGQFVVISTSPANMTRSGYGTLKGYSNNTLGSTMHNVTLNWTLPAGWTNSSGSRTVFDPVQNAGEILWNNITAYANVNSLLGPQTVELRSTSAEGYEDWDTRTINVYARTYIKNLHPNSTDPSRGEVVLLTGQLALDNGTSLPYKNVSMYDVTAGVSMGSDETDNLGWFYIYYMIPSGAALGNHTLNATFPGQLASYILKSWNRTWMRVHDKPKIINVSDSPDPQGYSYRVTIRANVTDLEGVKTVRVCVTPPAAAQTCYAMTNYTKNIYTYNYTNTWTWGNYSYYIWANDSAGKINQSATYYIHIRSNATIQIFTAKSAYGPLETVNLTTCSAGAWTDTFSNSSKINASASSNYNVTGGEVRLSSASYTKVYDFASCTGGTNCWAWDVETDAVPPEGAPNAETAATAANYASIAVSGGTRWALIDPGVGDYEWVRSQMRIVENRSKITRINFTGEGYGSVTSNSRIYVCNLTDNGVALPNCDAWIQVVQQQVTQNPPDTTVSGSITSRISDFVSSSGYIYWVWGISGVASEYLSVDYVKLDVTYSGYAPSGYVTSTAATPANLASWVKMQASDSLPSSTSMNFSVLNAADNSVLCSMTSAQAVAGFNISSCAAKAASVKLRANMATTNMSKTPRLYDWNATWKNGSCIANLGATNITGYMLLKVQRYSGGSWVDVASNNPVVNDSSARAFSRRTSAALKPIWNGAGEGDGWNTAKEPIGKYRVYAALRDPSGNLLKNDDGSFVYDTYNFTITNPPYIIQLRQIRLYDVTNAASKKTDKTYLMGSGLNSTFTLFTNKTYRAEVVVWNNASSTAAWTVSASDAIFHSGLNSSWKVNASGNIWYANRTTNLTGGTWSGGKVAWNTSKGGRLGINENMTFYYIFNITSTSSKDYPVHFMLNDTMFTREDPSIYHIVLLENQPPRLYNLIYNITKNLLHRSESLVVYARWNEAIAQARAEYNSTIVALQNHTITLPVPNPQYWTNHTIATTTFWRLGVHKAKIYAADLNSNWNNTLWYLPFTVWGRSSVSSSALSNYTITNGSAVTMRCKVTSDNGSAISSYNVSFFNSTSRLGSNLTNATGWAKFTFRDYSLGYESIKCNITNNTAIYHHITANNYGTQTLRTIETKAPWYISPLQNTSKIHRGERISLSAYWYDNYRLNYGWLESNQTGIFQNNSLAPRQLLNVSQMRVYFNVTMPTTSRLGRMGWRIWANDTSSNINKTNPRNYTYVWGYAIINASSLAPTPIYVNTYTTMRCKVVDYNNGSAISAYNVSFYSNATGYMGKNVTNSTGWARWRFNDTILGLQKITCNITSYPAKYYDPHSPSNASQVVRSALPGSDTTAPGATIYALNTTSIYKGVRVKIYAKWTENITAAVVRFNSTSSTIQSYTPSTISGQWTNHTMVTNSSWIVGVHYAKLNASDVWNNWNNTLAYLQFKVYGRSKVAWSSPTTTQYRGTIPLRCRVYDKDNNMGIGSYSVNFYNASWDYLGAAATNTSGIASYSWNATGKSVGSKTFYCTIVSSGYYNTTAADDDTSGTFDLYGRLNATIDAPANKTAFYKGKTVTLNSTTRDERNVVVTPDTARWYDGATQIAATQDATWVIPVSHNTGRTTIVFNVTKSYYSLSKKNVTIYVWGYSNVTWITPLGGNFSAGGIVSLTCRVRDVNSTSGILNYPVRFYYKNLTETSYHYLGVRAANSTGYSVYSWSTAGLPVGNYTARCNITNNATLYYNATLKRSGNTTIRLTAAAARLEVHLVLPPTLPGDGSATYDVGYKVGRNRTFVLKANVTCRNAACGNVQGTVRYNVTANPDTVLGTVYATPFYVAGALPANPKSCSGNPLVVNESCAINWTINATGALGSVWKLDVLFDGASALSNQTNYTRIRITKVLILHLSTNDIDWGSRNPQTTCNPGVNNGSFVNISLDANSNDADGIYLRGTDLTNSSYSIGIGNVTWAKVNLCTNGYNLNSSWAKMRNFTASGTSQPAYFWIDIPAVPALRYHGYTYVMANTSSSG